MYYEGKEYEIIKSDFKPGRLSPALRAALGINETSPPPWLYNMQRFGPPPAYPSLKIPGVNMVVSLSEGGTRYFQDENGFTIYADCHGLKKSVYQKRQTKKQYWGSLKQTSYQEVSESEGEDLDYASEEDQDPVYGHLIHSDGDNEPAAADTRAINLPTSEDLGQLFSGVKTLISDIEPQAVHKPEISIAKDEKQLCTELEQTDVVSG